MTNQRIFIAKTRKKAMRQRTAQQQANSSQDQHIASESRVAVVIKEMGEKWQQIRDRIKEKRIFADVYKNGAVQQRLKDLSILRRDLGCEINALPESVRALAGRIILLSL